MTPVSSILCPVDFSEGSRAALCYAAALADYFGARLTVITVDDPLLANAAAMEVLDPPLAVQSEAELRRFSDDVLPHLAARAKMLDFRVATGKPATEILSAAHATKADLIVIGSHGRSGLQKMFFGSTTRARPARDECACVDHARSASGERFIPRCRPHYSPCSRPRLTSRPHLPTSSGSLPPSRSTCGYRSSWRTSWSRSSSRLACTSRACRC